MDNDNVTTKELEELVRDAKGPMPDPNRDLAGYRKWASANNALDNMAKALAAEVLALRERETQTRKALEAVLRKVEVLRAAYGGEWQDVEGMVEDALAAAERSE